LSLESFAAEWMAGQSRSLGLWSERTGQIYQDTCLSKYPIRVAHLLYEGRPGVYLSANPYRSTGEIAFIERLFFDFDNLDNVRAAWKDTLSFAETLLRRYNSSGLTLFSGSKGYHVHVWLREPYYAETQVGLKAVYSELMRMLLARKSGSLKTFDPAVEGDIKRLSRVPYSKHQKTGALCVPVDADLNPYKLMPGFTDAYRRYGLPPEVVDQAVKNLSRKTSSKPNQRRHSGLRPCMKCLLNAKNIHDPAHLLKLGLVVELRAERWSRDEIIGVFRRMEGFNERKTGEQVDHALRRGYKPFRCETINKLGGCLGNICPTFRKRTLVGAATCVEIKR